MKEYKNGELYKKVCNVMAEHKGVQNAITRDKLFKKVIGVKYNKESLKHVNRWNSIRSKFSLWRREDKLFIQATQQSCKPASYFVPKKYNESAAYADSLGSYASSMTTTIVNAQRFVKNKEYKDF